MTLGVRKIKLLGVAAVALLAMSASGCSSLPSVPDWVDPTTWFGSSDDAAPDSGQAPDLASIPDKPNTTPDDKQQVADSLAADRSNAKYSADALRGGTEPAAAPPPDLPVPAKTEQVAEAKPKPKAPEPAVAPKPAAEADRSVAQDPSGATLAGALPATVPGYVPGALPPVEPVPTNSPTASNAASNVQTASLPEAAPRPATPAAKPATRVAAVAPPAPATPPPSVAPVAPAAPMAALPPGAQGPLSPTPVTNSISPSDAELGFKPSSAPPLDPSVSQFVSAPVIDRYRKSATVAGISSAPATHAARKPKKVAAMGGPERMTGNVVANLDVLHGGASAAPAVMAASYNNGAAAAVVYFPNDTVALSGAAKAQVKAAVTQYRASGGQGYIRVVGHSSSRTPNMSPEKHLELIFKKSQDRANAVAQEIIRAGVPASKVLVEAVGDTQPVYYESMPKGEDGNRRAEIYLQG